MQPQGHCCEPQTRPRKGGYGALRKGPEPHRNLPRRRGAWCRGRADGQRKPLQTASKVPDGVPGMQVAPQPKLGKSTGNVGSGCLRIGGLTGTRSKENVTENPESGQDPEQEPQEKDQAEDKQRTRTVIRTTQSPPTGTDPCLDEPQHLGLKMHPSLNRPIHSTSYLLCQSERYDGGGAPL